MSDEELFPRLWAEFDDDRVFVFQAFKDKIADAALELGTFGKGFTLDRMTWIKPSFGWMLHRSGWATKRRQTRILKIAIARDGFDEILAQGVPTLYDPEIFADEIAWGRALSSGAVRYQWDPERTLMGVPNGERAIQLGIRGDVVARYVHEWILGIEDVTDTAKHIGEAVRAKRRAPRVDWAPEVYPMDAALARALGVREQPPW